MAVELMVKTNELNRDDSAISDTFPKKKNKIKFLAFGVRVRYDQGISSKKINEY